MYSTQMNVLHDLCDILMAAPGVHPTCSQPSKVHFDAKRKPQMRSHLPSLPPGHFTKHTFDNIALYSNVLHIHLDSHVLYSLLLVYPHPSRVQSWTKTKPQMRFQGLCLPGPISNLPPILPDITSNLPPSVPWSCDVTPVKSICSQSRCIPVKKENTNEFPPSVDSWAYLKFTSDST